ncbi:MAG TPA: AAA family ATPase [Candidatus Baltobacteraceae bacterium]|nr:AAA family ATPase [Candidatus Baltobacteraceae bacterium]
MPPALPGRENLIDTFNIAIQRLKRGRAAKSLLPYGLRGVGKTVLLRAFRG